MANNDANMGWGDREEAPFEAEGEARPAGEGPDGRDGGRPEGQGEAREMMVGATDGALNYVTYMSAAGKTNAEIARTSIDYIKTPGWEPEETWSRLCSVRRRRHLRLTGETSRSSLRRRKMSWCSVATPETAKCSGYL